MLLKKISKLFKKKKTEKIKCDFSYKNRYEDSAKKLLWNPKYDYTHQEELKNDIRLQYQELLSMIRHLSLKRVTMSSVFVSINFYFIYSKYGTLFKYMTNNIFLYLALSALSVLWYSSVKSLNNQMIMFFADLDELQCYLPTKPFGNNMANIRFQSNDKEYMPHYTIEYRLACGLLLVYLGEALYNITRLILHIFNIG